jgi:hypothetical protein
MSDLLKKLQAAGAHIGDNSPKQSAQKSSSSGTLMDRLKAAGADIRNERTLFPQSAPVQVEPPSPSNNHMNAAQLTVQAQAASKKMSDLEWLYGAKKNDDGSVQFPSQQGLDAYNELLQEHNAHITNASVRMDEDKKVVDRVNTSADSIAKFFSENVWRSQQDLNGIRFQINILKKDMEYLRNNGYEVDDTIIEEYYSVLDSARNVYGSYANAEDYNMAVAQAVRKEETSGYTLQNWQSLIDNAIRKGDWNQANSYLTELTQANLPASDRDKAVAYIDKVTDENYLQTQMQGLWEQKDSEVSKEARDARSEILLLADRGQWEELFALMHSEKGKKYKRLILQEYGIDADSAESKEGNYFGLASQLQYGNLYDYNTLTNSRETYKTQLATNTFRQRAQDEIQRAGKSHAHSAQMDSYVRAQSAYYILNSLSGLLGVEDAGVQYRVDGPTQYLIDYLASECSVDLSGMTEANYRSMIRSAMEEQSKKAIRMGKILKSEGFDTDVVREYAELAIQTGFEGKRMEAFDKWNQNAGTGEKILTDILMIPYRTGIEPLTAGSNLLAMVGEKGDNDNPNKYVPMLGIQSPSDLVRSAASEAIEKNTNWELFDRNVSSFLYNAGMSAADSAANAFSYGTFSILAMGTRAAGAEANDILARGGSREQAFRGGLAAGAIEAITEYVSVDKLLSAAGTIDSLKAIFKSAASQAFTEGTEEMSSEILNIIVDSVNMGNLSRNSQAVKAYMDDLGMSYDAARQKVLYDNIEKVVESGVSGFLSGGFSGGIKSTAAYIDYRTQKKAIDLLGNVDENTDAYKICQALHTAGSEMTEDNRIGVMVELVLQGASQEDADHISNVVKKAVNGKQLSSQEKSLLKKDPLVGKVLRSNLQRANPKAQTISAPERTETEVRADVVQAENPKATVIRSESVQAYIDTGKVTLKNAQKAASVLDAIVSGEKTELTANEIDSLMLTTTVGSEVASKILGIEVPRFAEKAAARTQFRSIVNQYVQTRAESQNTAPVATEQFDGQIVQPDAETSVAPTYSTPDEAYESTLHADEQFAEPVVDTAPEAAFTDSDFVDASSGFVVPHDQEGDVTPAHNEAHEESPAQPRMGYTAFAEKYRQYFNKNATDNELGTAYHRYSNPDEDGEYHGVRPSAEAFNLPVETVKAIDALGKLFGLDISFENLGNDNGYYVTGTNKVVMDIDPKRSNVSNAFLFTASHELGHAIRDRIGKEAWSAFEKYAVAAMGGEKAVQAKQKQNAVYKNPTEAREDVACDFLGKLMSDKNTLDTFCKAVEKGQFNAEYAKGIGGLMQKIVDRINSAKLSKAIRKRWGKDIANAKNAAQAILKAAEAAKRVKQQEFYGANEVVSAEGLVKHSRKYDDQYMDKAERYNAKSKAVSDSVMDQARKDRARVKARLAEMERKGVILPADNEKGSKPFSNSSYGGVSEENTSICVRSLALEDLVNLISEATGRPLTVEEQLYISQYVQTVPGMNAPECTYCYVAADRKAYREYLGEYIKQRDAVIEAYKNGETEYSFEGKYGTGLYEKFLNKRKNTEPMQKRFQEWISLVESGKQLISPADVANLAKLDGDLTEFHKDLIPQIKDAMKYAQAASWAKKRVGFIAYNGHILKWRQSHIDALNSQFGLRMYSFSDFSPAFILENMQMFTDAAVKGLKVLAYTKELAFAKIFAPTGANINVSVFGFEKDGVVAENAMMGAPWDEVKALRAKYKNVGTVFVATSDNLVNWALEQDWIDVVIPYHLVRTGRTIAQIMDYMDYTDESSDTKEMDWKSDDGEVSGIYPTMHHNDKETYLAELKKNRLQPRFKRFLDNPNYMKLVNETRQSDLDTEPVQPVFDMEAANVALGQLELDGYYTPIGGTVDRMEQIALGLTEDISSGKAQDWADQKKSEPKNNFGKNPKVKKSVKEIDADYMSAVESGDMEAAQRMVDDAAKKAGFPVKAYHGTPTGGFTAFDVSKIGSNTGVGRGRFSFTSDRKTAVSYANQNDKSPKAETIVSSLNDLFKKHDSDALRILIRGDAEEGTVQWDSDAVIADGAIDRGYVDFDYNWEDTDPGKYSSEKEARNAEMVAVFEGTKQYLYEELSDLKKYAPESTKKFFDDAFDMLDTLSGDRTPMTYSVYLSNPTKIVDADSDSYNEVAWDAVGSEDSVVAVRLDNGETRYFVRDPNLIKSADPVTYDDNGNVIPLSERFNEEKTDIRYSKKEFESAGTEDLYKGKDLSSDSSVYDYDFLASLPPMNVPIMLPLAKVKAFNTEKNKIQISPNKAADLGMENARAYGGVVEKDGTIHLRNRYTGHDIKVSRTGLKHSIDGDENRQRTNARLSAIGGDLIVNAIPINALKDESPTVNGTYAMAVLANSRDRNVVAIITVEMRTNNLVDIDFVETTHSISGRLVNTEKESNMLATRALGNLNEAPYGVTLNISIADFLSIVNRTYQSILSDNVLNYLKEERDPEGYYTPKVKFSKKDTGIESYEADSSTGVNQSTQSAKRNKGPFVVPTKAEADMIAARQAELDKESAKRRDALRDSVMNDLIRNARGSRSKLSVKDEMKGLVDKHGAIPKGEKPVRDVEVPTRTTSDTKVRRTVRTAMEAAVTPDSMIPLIEDRIIEGSFGYNPVTNKQRMQSAYEWVETRDIGSALNEWLFDVGSGKLTADLSARGMLLYNNYVNASATETDVDERNEAERNAADILAALSSLTTVGAQITQFNRMLKRLSPETQIYALERNVKKLQETINRELEALKRPKIELKLNSEWMEMWAKELRRGPLADSDFLYSIEGVIFADIAKQVPKRFIDKWNAWRYLSMLGNPKTLVRNTFGNALFMPAKALKDAIGTGLERIFIKDTSKRTKALKGDKDVKQFAKQDYKSSAVKRLIDTGNGKYSMGDVGTTRLEKAIRDAHRNFDAWGLRHWQKATNYVMNDMRWFSDSAFMSHHYETSFARIAKARGITAKMLSDGAVNQETLDEMRAYAVNEALKATYKDVNAVSKFMSKLKSKNKIINFALEGIVPFRATPANVMLRAVEYSPVGLLKAISADLYRVRNGDISSSEYLDRLSSGLSGTAIWGLGWLLASMGMIRVGADDDEKREGKQNYSLEIGDWSITLDWVAPASIPFFMGASMRTILGADDGANFLDAVMDATSTFFAPMLEMSMLSGMQDLLDTFTYGDGFDFGQMMMAFFVQPFFSYIGQLVPTVLGQVANTLEPNRTTTYVGDITGQVSKNVVRMIAKISEKIPFVDWRQMDYVDTFGRKEPNGPWYARVLNNFFNPAYVNQINVTDPDAEIRRLEEVTGEEISPKRPDYSITVAQYDSFGKKLSSEKIALTADQFEAYSTAYGQQYVLMMTEMMASTFYDTLSDEEKVEAISEIDQLAKEYGKISAGVGYRTSPGSSQRKILDLADKHGIPIAEIYGVKLYKDQLAKDDMLSTEDRKSKLVQMISGVSEWSEDQKSAVFSYATAPETPSIGEHKPSSEQKNSYADIYGKYASEVYESIVHAAQFASLPDEEKSAMIDIASDLISFYAKREWATKYGIKSDSYDPEKESNKFDTLIKGGFSFFDAYAIKDKYNEIRDSAEYASNTLRATAYVAWVDNQKGWTTNQKDLAKNAYKFTQTMIVDPDKYNKLKSFGLDANKASMVVSIVSAVKPLSGETTVSDVRKWQAIVNSKELTTSEKDKSIRAYMSESVCDKYDFCSKSGVTASMYVEYYNAKYSYGDGNGYWNQKELESWLRSKSWSNKQKHALWISAFEDPKYNPFD